VECIDDGVAVWVHVAPCYNLATTTLPKESLVGDGAVHGAGGTSAFVVLLASLDVLGSVAVEGEVVEDGSLGAAVEDGGLAVQADVEGAAVVGLDVARVVEHVAVGVHLRGVGAAEAVIQDLGAVGAAGADAGVLPLAHSGELVEHEPLVAAVHGGHALGALVVLAAVAHVLVLEVAVAARALDADGLGRLLGVALRADHGEGVVALLGPGGLVVEDEAVGAQLLGERAAVAVVIQVALHGVAVEAVLRGAPEGALGLGAGNGGGEDDEREHDEMCSVPRCVQHCTGSR